MIKTSYEIRKLRESNKVLMIWPNEATVVTAIKRKNGIVIFLWHYFPVTDISKLGKYK